MMNKSEILRKVGEILAELNDQHDYLSSNPESLNDLELELFAANAEFLSNHISILVKLNGKTAGIKEGQGVSAFTPESDSMQTLNSDSTNSEKKEEEISDWKSQLEVSDDIRFDFEKKEANELFDRPLTEEEIRVIGEKTRLKDGIEDSDLNSLQQVISEAPKNQEEELEESIAESIQSDEPMPEPVSVPQEVKAEPEPIPSRIVAEPASAETAPLSLNEILAAQTSRATVSSQLNQRQTKDLKGMISLNDKLLFVRDLFNGYSLAYSEAIELLNRFDTFESADNFLKQNYVSKNSWAEKQDVADKFYELLNKRFSS